MSKHTSLFAELRQSCIGAPGKIALPDSDDTRILQVTAQLLGEGSVAEVTLFGDKTSLIKNATTLGIDLQRFDNALRIVPAEPAAAEPAAAEPAAAAAESALTLAAELLAKGAVDAVVAGNKSTTAQVIRAGISGVGLAPGVRTVSGAFIMNRDGDAVYLYADCGVVIAPTEKQLCDIAAESVKTWTCLFPDVKPVVAFLSFSTRGSATHEAQKKMAAAAAKFRSLHPEVISDGEMQFDAAFDAGIGSAKAPGSLVPGRANCFIFPDLNAGNIAYKITQRLAGFHAYGPILQGLAKPFCDLSRGSTVEDILASCYINLKKARNQEPN